MVKVLVNSMIIVLISVASVFGSATSAAIPDTAETAHTPDTSNERNLPLYHLATLPSTNKKRVDAMCIKFLSLIPKAKLVPATAENTVYRLIADTFDTLDPAKKRTAELKRFCESPFVLKTGHGYTVIAASHMTGPSAAAEQRRLAARNIPTTIAEVRVPLKKWQMRSSESFTIREAVSKASALSKIGVTTTLEPSAD